MATATAPEKTVATRRIQPREYIFKLTGKIAEDFKKREVPGGGKLMLAMQDDIYWPYIDDKPVTFGAKFDKKEAIYLPRSIRYVVGANSIFLDEQEKTGVYKIENGRNRLLDNPANRDRLTFENIELRVPANEVTLLRYVWCNNQCRNQYEMATDNFGRRAKSVNASYEMLDFGYQEEEKINLGELKEKAYEAAKTARTNEMLPHAKFLNISFTHEGSDTQKDTAALREDYKDFAYHHPAKFLETFNTPMVKVVYQIRGLVEDGKILLGGRSVGQAHWNDNGAFIAQLPPDQDPVSFLAEYSLSKAGEEFSNNLRAITK